MRGRVRETEIALSGARVRALSLLCFIPFPSLHI